MSADDKRSEGERLAHSVFDRGQMAPMKYRWECSVCGSRKPSYWAFHDDPDGCCGYNPNGCGGC